MMDTSSVTCMTTRGWSTATSHAVGRARRGSPSATRADSPPPPRALFRTLVHTCQAHKPSCSQAASQEAKQAKAPAAGNTLPAANHHCCSLAPPPRRAPPPPPRPPTSSPSRATSSKPSRSSAGRMTCRSKGRRVGEAGGPKFAVAGVLQILRPQSAAVAGTGMQDGTKRQRGAQRRGPPPPAPAAPPPPPPPARLRRLHLPQGSTLQRLDNHSISIHFLDGGLHRHTQDGGSDLQQQRRRGWAGKEPDGAGRGSSGQAGQTTRAAQLGSVAAPQGRQAAAGRPGQRAGRQAAAGRPGQRAGRQAGSEAGGEAGGGSSPPMRPAGTVACRRR